MVGKTALLPADLSQCHARPAQLLGHRHAQIAGVFQFFEVFAEEAVFLVVNRSALPTSSQNVVR
jgi:hypothetical protein